MNKKELIMVLIVIGLLTLYLGLTNFYIDSGGLIGNDYFFIDFINMDYSLTGGL